MKTKGKKLISYITAIAMLITVFNIPLMGYAAETQSQNDAKEYGIFMYDYETDDGETIVEVTEFEENIATLPGDPYEYFYLETMDDEEYIDSESVIKWTSSDDSVAKCIVNEDYDSEVKLHYVSVGSTTISAELDGVKVASFELELNDIAIQCATADQLEYEDEPYFNHLYYFDDFEVESVQPMVVRAVSGSRIFDEDKPIEAEWSIEDTSVAIVESDKNDNIIVTGLKQGYTTITATEKNNPNNSVTYDLYVWEPVLINNAWWLLVEDEDSSLNAALYAADEGWTGVIPESVQYEGKSYVVNELYGIIIPYEDAREVETIKIPATVTNISNQAFYCFGKLKNITVDADNTAYYSKNGVLFTAEKILYVYPAGKTETKYSIPSGTKGVDINAFDNNNYSLPLKQISTPASLDLEMGYNYFSILGDWDSDTQTTNWKFKLYVYGKNSNVIRYAKDFGIPYTLHEAAQLKAPEKVNATLYGYDDVKLSWSKVANANGYYVYYKKSTSKSYTLLKRTTATTLKKAGLTDGAKYYFKVVPYVKVGDVRYKATKYKNDSIYTLKKLSTPKVTKNGMKVKVKWNNISGETGYQISRSTKKSSINVIGTYATTKGTYKIIKAKKGAKYYYRVRAYKQVGKTKIYGPWSAPKYFKR